MPPGTEKETNDQYIVPGWHGSRAIPWPRQVSALPVCTPDGVICTQTPFSSWGAPPGSGAAGSHSPSPGEASVGGRPPAETPPGVPPAASEPPVVPPLELPPFADDPARPPPPGPRPAVPLPPAVTSASRPRPPSIDACSLRSADHAIAATSAATPNERTGLGRVKSGIDSSRVSSRE